MKPWKWQTWAVQCTAGVSTFNTTKHHATSLHFSLKLSPDWLVNWLAVRVTDGVGAHIQHIQGKALTRHLKAPQSAFLSEQSKQESNIFIYHSDSNWYSSPWVSQLTPFKLSISETVLSPHTIDVWASLTFSCRLMELHNSLPAYSQWLKWNELYSVLTISHHLYYFCRHGLCMYFLE